MEYQVTLGAERFALRLEETADLGRYRVRGSNAAFDVQVLGGRFDQGRHAPRVVLVNGQVLRIGLLPAGEAELAVHLPQGELHGAVTNALMARLREVTGDGGAVACSVKSPLPGRVVRVMAQVGAWVAAGAPLVAIEAMKMENEILAPQPGTVAQVRVVEGQSVEGGALLVELEPQQRPL
jgi:glutaconyl-CoA/methylmalonyl-CoA decarboxylase subunit gamma